MVIRQVHKLDQIADITDYRLGIISEDRCASRVEAAHGHTVRFDRCGRGVFCCVERSGGYEERETAQCCEGKV